MDINRCPHLFYVCGEYFCENDEGDSNMHSSWQLVCKKCKNIKQEEKMNIAMVGLGKIGSCLLAYLAYRGNNVIGVDINQDIVEKLENGIAPYPETNLQNFLTRHKNRIKTTTKYIDAVPYTDVAVVRVATPSKDKGDFDSEYLEQAIAEIGRCIPEDKKYYLVIVTSTVMPGTMREKIAPLLEQTSNRKLGKNLGLCYIPDFVALGNVLDNLLHPDMLILGESDEIAGDYAEAIFRPTNNAPVHRMNFYNAETAKLANNNFISMKISFANTITEYCETIPEGDASIVLDAIGSDTRIGKKFMKPGLGFAGFCYPRDQQAFIQTAIAHGIKPILAHATDKINENVATRISLKLNRLMQQEKTNKIAILGLTYKPDTVYTKESTTIKIIELLTKHIEDIDITVYDPGLDAKEIAELSYLWVTAKFKRSIEECLKDQKIVFIGTPWKQFRDIPLELFIGKTIIDSFGVLNTPPELIKDLNIKYIRIGTDKFNWIAET